MDETTARERRTFTIGERVFGARGELFVFAGPDLVEPLELCLEVGERARDICAGLGVGYIYKGSFDKANRTSIDGYRGPGLEAGLENLRAVKERLGVPVVTDLHLPEQAEAIAEVASVLQIPAFLCRQTDLLEAAARTGLPVSVKKGQFLAPWDMARVAEKLEAFGCGAVVLVERGASFGYNMLVSDMRAIPIMQETGWPVCYDACHAQQLPSGRGQSSGGMRAMIQPTARAAVAAGADAVFFEVHPDPPSSRVDPDTHLHLDDLEPLLTQLVAIKRIVG